MKILAWVEPGTWPAVVAAVNCRPDGDEVTLVAAADAERDIPSEFFKGLVGRAMVRSGDEQEQLSALAAHVVLEKAQQAVGRPCSTHIVQGRTERALTRLCVDADVLIVARDGDRSRLGPRSIGPVARFVVDHAPCTVVLVWPGRIPDINSIPG